MGVNAIIMEFETYKINKDIDKSLKDAYKLLLYINSYVITNNLHILKDFKWHPEKISDLIFFLSTNEYIEARLTPEDAKGNYEIHVGIKQKGKAFLMSGKTFINEYKRERTKASKEWYDTYIGRWTATALFVLAVATFLIDKVANRKVQVIRCECHNNSSTDNHRNLKP